MKLFNTIRYFFFIAFNWNWPIAFYLLNDNAYGHKKYGIDTTGFDRLKSLKQLGIDISQSTIYMPVAYKMLEILFNKIRLRNYKHFLDIGCGKGRALCVAAYFGVEKITGIDFYPELCRQAQENLKLVKEIIPEIRYEVCVTDARSYDIPADTDCLFFFNPFNETVMQTLAGKIVINLKQHPRKLTVLYVNPLHKDVFLNHGFTEIFSVKKLKLLEAVVLESGTTIL